MKRLIMVFLVLISALTVVALKPEKAEAAVCPTFGVVPNNIFPRDWTGTRENFGCSPADSYIWMSSYHAGSPLNTPNARFRVFFNLADVAARPDPIDTINFFSPDGSRVRCGFSMNIGYDYFGGSQAFNISKTVASGCAWPTFFGFIPGSFDVYRGQLFTQANTGITKYGPDMGWIDIQLSLATTATNAPFKIWATQPGSVAKVTFVEQNLPNAQNPGDYNMPGGFANAMSIWTDDMGLGPGSNEPITYTLRFAPDCTISPGQLVDVYFKWYDADGPTSPTQDFVFNSYIIDDTTGGIVWTENSLNYPFGGDDTYGQVGPITLVGGHVYRWQWSEITRNNGIQIVMPFSEMSRDVGCVVDECPNLPGLQATVPAGYFKDGAGNCIPDLCPNIPGGQNPIPPGYFVDGAGNCVADLCPNIPGGQNPIPPPYQLIGGNCVYAQPDCVSVTYSANPVQPGQPFTITVNVSNAAGGPYAVDLARPDTTLAINAAAFGYTNANAAYAPNPLAPSTAGSFTTPPVSTTSLGTFSITASFNSGTWGSDSCVPPVIRVAAIPYFKATRGEIAVGGVFNNGAAQCSTVPASGQLAAYAQQDSPGVYRGSSVDFAMYATGAVTSFYTSAANPGALPAFKALAFANDAASGTYGGSLGGIHCITDYYSTTKQGNPPAPPGPGNAAWNAVYAARNAQNQVERIGDLTPNGGDLNLSAGERLAVYVTGDVFISQNINLATNYATDNAIPFFALVVRGNIFISPSVTNLDGIYVAQRNAGGTGGGFYTCASGINGFYSAGDGSAGSSTLHSNCSVNRLTVNGSVVAQKIKLLRTRGTMQANPANADPAEVFNLLPDLFLAEPAFRIDPSRRDLYDSATSLPPFL